MKLVLVNALTLSRVPLSLMFCAAALSGAHPLLPCGILFALVAASDYLDGKLSRKYRVQTGAGAVLDVTADFFFIVTACAALSLRGPFPGWMIAVVVYKFVEFWISSALMKRKDANMFFFDPLGRAAAALFYLLPMLALLLQSVLCAAACQTALQIFCAAVTALAIASSFFRIASLTR